MPVVDAKDGEERGDDSEVEDGLDLGADKEQVLGQVHQGDAKDKHRILKALDGSAGGSGRLVWFLRLPAGKVLR